MVHTLELAIERAVREANRDREMSVLCGVDGEGDPREALWEVLNAACNRVAFLIGHVHEWNDDSYCVHCGADGRA